jgi:aminoglycoside phosphotransferase (APT) family kinase protein
VDAVPGIDAAAIGEWLVGRGVPLTPPLRFRLIAGGQSNLTYHVTDRDGVRAVLRRPPLFMALASAHDVGREHRIMAALQGTDVPVPELLAMCDDPDVTGAPFYLMRYVDGLVLRSRDDGEAALAPDARARASRALVDVLAALHTVDPAAVGLETLGRPDGYVERQLKRWLRQYTDQHVDPIPAVERVHARLVEIVPPQQRSSIVHGDYRLDNTLVSAAGEVRAVLDWELCTLGDPIADLATTLVYWTGPDDLPSGWLDTATVLDGFWNRGQVADRYAEVTGADLSALPYYAAFASWKLACILAGVHARRLAGAIGDVDREVTDRIGAQATAAADQAERILDGEPFLA